MKNVIVIFSALLLLAACTRKQINIPTQADLAFREYLTAYTSGIVSKTDDITLILKDTLSQNLIENTKLLAKAISVSPSFGYTLEVTNGKTIQLHPTQNLEPGTRYQVDVNMAKLLKKELTKEVFPLVFETKVQDFALNNLKLESQNINTPNMLALKGTITTDDVARLEDIKKLITQIGDLPLANIHWIQENPREYHFILKDIKKEKKNYSLAISINGASIGQNRIQNNTINVPGIQDFKLNSWEYSSSPDQILTLVFTETLDTKQDLKGLIEIEDIKNFTYTISGNTVKLFLNNSFTGATKLKLYTGIENTRGKKTLKNEEYDLVIEEPLPSVEIIGTGTILPNSQGLIIPFKTIGLKKVDVAIFKIYDKNMLQFLQVNDIADKNQLRRVAEKVKTKTINLAKDNDQKLKQWITHGLNLKDLIDPEPGAIYRVRFSFSQAYTFCECDEEINASYVSEYNDYYENDRYNNRKDYGTCQNLFYYYSTRSKNLLASDLGVITKKGTKSNYTLITTNLVNGTAQPNATIRFYNYQQRLVKTIQTNEQGIAKINFNEEEEEEEEPYILIAQSGKHKAYVKLRDGRTNSLSKFDTEGITRSDGIDAFFYGERGVWRPGDDIHLSFIVRDEFSQLKSGLPIKLTLKNPKGQLVQTKQLKLTTSGIHTAVLATEQDAPTGNYNAVLTVGSHTFYKTLKVETVRPNRLKIKIETPQDAIHGADNQQIALYAEWLHGATASELKANVNMVLTPMYTSFAGYKDYNFEDITKNFDRTERTIFDGKLDSLGMRNIALSPLSIKSKGKLKASFVTKVFEKGGGFSIDQMNTIYHPYNTYVGMKLPLSNYGSLPTERDNKIDLVCVDTKGKRKQTKDTLALKIYKLEWRWWWRHNRQDIASYVHNNSYNLVADEQLITVAGRASYTLRVDEYNWGQYYIQVTDKNGHSTSRTVYVDYPGNERKDQKKDNAMLLTMQADKDKYETGQVAKISFPSASAGRALVSIENDIEVVKTFWVNTQKGTSTFSLKIDKDMAPNCYVHVTALQKHKQEDNDLPLRMYGVKSITVFDKNTILNPVIAMREEIRPEVNNTITIREKNGRGMHYTLALVDEGLLDLTRYSTPNVWQHFNQKRALGVSTWDVYDDVIKSFSGKFDNVYRIGGDGAGKGGNTAKANRFKPVVKFLGPFYLKPGQKASHLIHISNYVGSVRAMVVARSGNAFGKTDFTAKVKKPLMIQANAPRVLTPRDELAIPVTVFATEKVQFPVTLTIKSDDHLIIENPKVTLTEVTRGEKVIFIKTKVTDKIGAAKLTISAVCANDKHAETMEIPIRLPGYEIDEVQDTFLSKGQSATLSYDQLGWLGTNKAMVEVSQYPSINLDKRLRYLIQYPHGCIEQTTSSVFPQLFLAQLTKLPAEREKRIERNIEQGIKRIQKFMTMSGGFSYWPGGYEASEWGSNYAGHFLIEAKAQGYYVPEHMLQKWYTYQLEKANTYSTQNTSRYRWNQDELMQAYRLYTLALYGKAELGAMNRLKEHGLQTTTAQWRLASAYAIAGQVKAAEDMVADISYEIRPYRDDYYSYGSQWRDQAIILESMGYLQNQRELHNAMKQVANNLGSQRWMSTQETAYSLCAFGKVVSQAKKGNAAYSLKENKLALQQVIFDDIISQKSVKKVQDKNTITLTNTGDNPLYIRLINTGTPRTTEIESGANGLAMSTTYSDANGRTVSKDSFTFGEDYKVTLKIKNTNNKERVNNVALSTYFPAGFEIQNSRLFATEETNHADYEDIRDDKIHTYFGLGPLQSKTFTYSFTASFAGTYLHPGFHCEAMYDASVYAREKGTLINIR